MGFTPIKLDKIRNLRYGMKAISLIEKRMKKSVSQIDMEALSMEDAATFLWAGLAHEDKDLTVDKVMDLVDEHSTIPEALAAMGEAFTAAFGAPKEADDPKNEQKAANPSV